MKDRHNYQSNAQLDLPEPDEIAKEHSRRLVEIITHNIENNNGSVGFDRYMGMALYEPGLGYYSAGARKLGHDGDFTTSPEISPLFSYCLARQCQEVFEITGGDQVLELGAGSGIMACDILSELKRLDALPSEYLILETSAELKQRQYQTIQDKQPDLLARVKWLDGLPAERISGIILANEVLDAIPVHRIKIVNNTVREQMVCQDKEQFSWTTADISDNALVTESNKRLQEVLDSLEDGYQTEINMMINPFLRSISEILSVGAALFIDYGYTRVEYYHPQRTTGTLVCHYRHRSHDNPFILVGCQDITAFVDFTSVAEAAHEVGLEVTGYLPQGAFLLSCDIEDVMNTCRNDDEVWNLKLSQQAGELILPGGMGEKFKVMALTRNITSPMKGFKDGNGIHRL